MASRSTGTPGIGAYWLRPSRMCRATASTSAGSQSKSGNPCDRLIAPRSAASFDMTVKMVVPTFGSFDCSITRSLPELKLRPTPVFTPGAKAPADTSLHAGAKAPADTSLHAGAEAPVYTSLHAGAEAPVYTSLYAGAEAPVYTSLHAGAEAPADTSLHAGAEA